MRAYIFYPYYKIFSNLVGDGAPVAHVKIYNKFPAILQEMVLLLLKTYIKIWLFTNFGV